MNRSFRPFLAAPLPRDVEVSFELFPPKSAAMERSLWSCIERLSALRPSFISVTYGAGGSTRERTHTIVTRLHRETEIPAAAHLTCIGATRAAIDGIARTYWEAGIRHIVALRGDPPKGSTSYQPHPDGYAYAVDLVRGLTRLGDFDISVAAYPETHPEAASAAADLDNLKRKIDAGARRAITQFFFDVETYLRFLERARAAGITVPIIAGVLPVHNFEQVARFARGCGASVPSWMPELFDGLDRDPETSRMVAVSLAAEHCRALYAAGVRQFHFYTLNLPELTYAVCHMLGVRPALSSS